MPKNNQRLRVWKGELRKTTGGLTRDDLMKNNKGKIVSKRKSLAMKKINNLGEYLREKGQPFKIDKKPPQAPAKAHLPAAKKKEKVKVVKPPNKLKKMLTKVVRKGKKQTRAARKDIEWTPPSKSAAAPTGTVDWSKRPKRVRKKRVMYNAN